MDRRFGDRAEDAHGVEHHVATPDDQLTGDSLSPQVVIGGLSRSEAHVTQMIGNDPVDLFRHRPVERT